MTKSTIMYKKQFVKIKNNFDNVIINDNKITIC